MNFLILKPWFRLINLGFVKLLIKLGSYKTFDRAKATIMFNGINLNHKWKLFLQMMSKAVIVQLQLLQNKKPAKIKAKRACV